MLNINSPKIQTDVRIHNGNRSVIVDLVLEDRNAIYYIDIKKKLTPEAVARFYAAVDLISTSATQKKENVFIIATQYVDPVAMKIADRLGIRVEEIAPLQSYLDDHGINKPFKIKITADKAWKSLFALLMYQPTSIYDVMKKSGVSYGQAHRVVTYLKSRSLIKQKGSYVSISDVKPILNAVFWERPLSSLIFTKCYIDPELTDSVLLEVSDILSKSRVKHAVTGLTAYERYFGGIRRNGPLDLYVDVANPSYQGFIDEFSSHNGKSPNLIIYNPDRDVFSAAHTDDGIQLVGKEQLLLDLSGGDKISVQYALEMVKQIGKI